MRYLPRLAVVAAVIAVWLWILVVFAAGPSNSLESIQYDELTCEELTFSYDFNKAVLEDMMTYHDGCLDFADSPASVGPHDYLSCRFIREHGLFVQGIVNDVAAVFNIKCANK